ncbi:hypothetical protein HHK36_023055 [Tetracentron sinense]|uniref:Uncharacterized protein n=1 Tax=Tetracentron sinense TaxID=13715 RepID=A0A834YW02_TETSI|nr:hypothetical protein HHK36_023055 [Tetracentron sinense]
MRSRWSSASAFRWPEFDLSYLTTGWSSPSFRWPGLDLTMSERDREMRSGWSSWAFRWPEFDISDLRMRWRSQSLGLGLTMVDNVLWSFVTVFESLALVAMLCSFFLFCGCTL